jgi:CRISPR system Cascade subunit CasA
MNDKHFNLLTEPWLKVIDLQGQEQDVSLVTLFKNASNYARLAGEMQAQDLAILRLLLAILTTVYSRFNAQNENYDWLETDPETFLVTDSDQEDYEDDGDDDFLETWQDFYEQGCFSKVLFDYLEAYADRFDFFDEKRPFYQVNKEDYNSLVEKKKAINIANPKGTVAVKQLNRTVSESGNSRDVFSPRDESNKNQISLPELIRWLISYQNFTGVTDKTKVKSTDKFSASGGWLYSLNPVYAQGNNLFETLMLNLSFSTENNLVQNPIWEYDSPLKYVDHLLSDQRPDNLAELYTNWSRILHLEFTENEVLIFAAGLPKVEVAAPLIEPMTTWKFDNKNNALRPQTRWINSLEKSMWRDFGSYVRTNLDAASGSAYVPGEIVWLNKLKNKRLITINQELDLRSVSLVNDGNASSQMPAAQISENMQIRAGVLFDNNEYKRQYWPGRIQDAIELTQAVGKKAYLLGRNIGNLRDPDLAASVANQISIKFYDRLNYPFYSWLASLKNDEDRDVKVNAWKQTVKEIAFDFADDILQNAGPREIKGSQDDDRISNIFTVCRSFRASVYKILD